MGTLTNLGFILIVTLGFVAFGAAFMICTLSGSQLLLEISEFFLKGDTVLHNALLGS